MGTMMMPEPEAARLLGQRGIDYPGHGLAEDPEAAVRIAGDLGYPVVLKAVSPQVVHKSDAGGVLVDLKDADAVRAGFRRIRENIAAYDAAAELSGVLVCRQAPPGVEVIIGGLRDAVFGPTVMVGLGGVFIEVIRDVSFRVAPFDEDEAREMLAELKGFPLLEGVRGGDRCDLGALCRSIRAVADLLIDRPDIREMDLNPLRIYKTGVLALDARIMVEA
jgi:acyl-CoA synthetase (NDP forming)